MESSCRVGRIAEKAEGRPAHPWLYARWEGLEVVEEMSGAKCVLGATGVWEPAVQPLVEMGVDLVGGIGA